MKQGPSRWGRLSPKKSKKSKLGRLTNISEIPPAYLGPLATQYEKIVTVEKTVDQRTGVIHRKRHESYRLDEHGERIPKIPRELAFGAWDIESHCYEHTCRDTHQKEKCRVKECHECHECPACNPEHGHHWIAAQLSVLRIPDAYIEYVSSLDKSQMFGGTRQEGSRYVEFLNGGASLAVVERARCVAPDGCIDRTLRFLMAHPCFFQKARASKGYIAKGEHTTKCKHNGYVKENDGVCLRSDGSECHGCLHRPYAPGHHTSKCRFERSFRKKDGTPCEGCTTLSAVWYSHFGGGYDINFALRWLSEHGSDSVAVKQAVFEVEDDERRSALKEILEKRYQYKAESLLAGATHIQVKLSKLQEVYKKPRPSRKALKAIGSAVQAAAAGKKIKDTREGPGSPDYWLKGFLAKGLLPAGDLSSAQDTQETLNIVMRAKLRATGAWDDRTKAALKNFQKKCVIEPTGIMNRETSAALRYLRSQTTREPDPNEVILLRDSFRLVGSSLSAAAKDFQLTHPVTGESLRKIDDIDVKNPPPPDDPDYRRYCRYDTEICVQLVMTFNKLIQQLGGTLEMTSSSCAVSLFRKVYLKERVPRHRHLTGCRSLCPHCGTETCSRECGASKGIAAGKNMERHQKLLAKHKKSMHKLCPTYPVGCFHFAALGKNGHRHGGHVDVLRQHLESGRCYDVNSLYPFAMLGPVPTGPMQRYVNPTPAERKTMKPGSAIAVAASAWQLQRKAVVERGARSSYWRGMIDRHGLDMATLEAVFRVGADPDPSDPDFDKIESFRRVKRCGYVEAIVSIHSDDSVPECYFPPLPVVRDSEGGEILFWPNGDGIHGWWCYEELRAILEVPGARLVALRQSIWFRGEPLFKEFIETLYDMRSKSEGAMKQLLKIIMNSTYGKTLQSPLKRRVIRLQSTQRRPPGWLPTNPNPPDGDDFTWPWGTVQEYREAPFFLPQWGSLITARARMVIWRICVDVERGAYGRGQYVSYLDSITGDRTVILQSPNKRTEILPVEDLWNRFADGSEQHHEEKEATSPAGWKALAMDPMGNEGWFPIEKVIRHRTSKTIWSITNKDGQTSVTSDHGIMMHSSNASLMAADPQTFVEEGANFIKLKAPRSVRTTEQIDLMEFIDNFHHAGSGNADLHFVAEGNQIRLAGWQRIGRWRHLDHERKANDALHEHVHGEVRFRRFYNPGSAELGALLRVIGAYIAEGSASFPDLEKDRNKWLFTISQKDKTWLESLQRDLDNIVTGLKVPIVEVSRHIAPGNPGSGMHALRSGAAQLPCFFSALAGKGSANKKLPSFAFDLTEMDLQILWNKLREGDGSVHPITGQESYTTKSQKLTAGISYLWDLLGLEHAIYYRESKSTWSLLTRPKGSSRTRKKTNVQSRLANDEWVYDLQVSGAHTFVDGIGRVLLHNTDSCYTTAVLPEDSKKLGMLKLEYQLPEKKRQDYLNDVEKAWDLYQKRHVKLTTECKNNTTLTSEKKAEQLKRLEDRFRYYRKEIYEPDRFETKYETARPDGLVDCEFYGPKLYLVLDPVTGAEVKTVHKGSPEPNAEKLRKFIQGIALPNAPKAPKAGVGIRDDFVFDPVVLERTGRKALWKRPKKGERDVMHKRVHHFDPGGRGTTSPRFINAREEFELEESFRERRLVSAAALFEEWTGHPWANAGAPADHAAVVA